MDGKEDSATYSLPGIIEYLLGERRRFEIERNKWEIEKAQFKAKIAQYEGEQRSYDHCRQLDERRIMMLEHALQRERALNRFGGLSQSDTAPPDKASSFTGLESLEKETFNSKSPPSIARHDRNFSELSDSVFSRTSTNWDLQSSLSNLSLHSSNLTDGNTPAETPHNDIRNTRKHLAECLDEISHMIQDSERLSLFHTSTNTSLSHELQKSSESEDQYVSSRIMEADQAPMQRSNSLLISSVNHKEGSSALSTVSLNERSDKFFEEEHLYSDDSSSECSNERSDNWNFPETINVTVLNDDESSDRSEISNSSDNTSNEILVHAETQERSITSARNKAKKWWHMAFEPQESPIVSLIQCDTTSNSTTTPPTFFLGVLLKSGSFNIYSTLMSEILEDSKPGRMSRFYGYQGNNTVQLNLLSISSSQVGVFAVYNNFSVDAHFCTHKDGVLKSITIIHLENEEDISWDTKVISTAVSKIDANDMVIALSLSNGLVQIHEFRIDKSGARTSLKYFADVSENCTSTTFDKSEIPADAVSPTFLRILRVGQLDLLAIQWESRETAFYSLPSLEKIYSISSLNDAESLSQIINIVADAKLSRLYIIHSSMILIVHLDSGDQRVIAKVNLDHLGQNFFTAVKDPLRPFFVMPNPHGTVSKGGKQISVNLENPKNPHFCLIILKKLSQYYEKVDDATKIKLSLHSLLNSDKSLNASICQPNSDQKDGPLDKKKRILSFVVDQKKQKRLKRILVNKQSGQKGPKRRESMKF